MAETSSKSPVFFTCAVAKAASRQSLFPATMGRDVFPATTGDRERAVGAMAAKTKLLDPKAAAGRSDENDCEDVGDKGGDNDSEDEHE